MQLEELELEILRDALRDALEKCPHLANTEALLKAIVAELELYDADGDKPSAALATVDEGGGDMTAWDPNDTGAVAGILAQAMGSEHVIENMLPSEQIIAVRDHVQSLNTQHDDMVHRLEQLKSVEAIFQENIRLRTELDGSGAVTEDERVAHLEKDNANLRSELDVANRQARGAQQALRSERMTRERTIGQTPHPDVPVIAALPKAKRPCPHRFDHLDCDRCNPDHPEYRAPGQPRLLDVSVPDDGPERLP